MPDDPSSVTVRHARHEDIQPILDMIRDLASFEKELDKVEATPETLRKTIAFADDTPEDESYKKVAKAFVLCEGSDVAGMAIYFLNYSTWRSRPGIYLEDLYVRPQYRKKGYAKLLIQTLAKETVAIGGGRLEWVCLKWNEVALKLYRSLGAITMDEWVTLRVDGDALVQLAERQP